MECHPPFLFVPMDTLKSTDEVLAGSPGDCYYNAVYDIRKALKAGASREEISEAIAIAMGVNAAAVVDLTDIAADNLDIKLY